ncbi:MAG: PQQ-binding-like beta-propeller repeat protein, partial [Candidatus Dormibacteria bacterium]
AFVSVVASNSRGGYSATVAYDATNGDVLWRQPFSDASAAVIWASTVSADGTLVYVNGTTQTIVNGVGQIAATTVAYDASTGAVRWTATVPGDVGSGVAAAGGRVFTAGAEYNNSSLKAVDMLAVDAVSGAPKGSSSAAIGGDDPLGLVASPDGSHAFFGYQDVFAFADGKQYETMALVAFAFHDTTASEAWKADYIGPNADSPTFSGYSVPWCWQPLAVAPDGSRVYMTAESSDGQFGAAGTGFSTAAFDAASGAQLWNQDVNANTPVFYIGGGPVVTVDPQSGDVYVGGEGGQAELMTLFAYKPADASVVSTSTYTADVGAAHGLSVAPDATQVFVSAELGTPDTSTHSVNYDIAALAYPTGGTPSNALPDVPSVPLAVLLAAGVVRAIRWRVRLRGPCPTFAAHSSRRLPAR